MINSLFLPCIIAIGCATSYTDLKYGYIKNIFLLGGFAYGVSIYVFLFISGSAGYSAFFLTINVFVSIVLAYVLYIKQIWSAGDGKLFILLSFFSPWLNYSSTFRLPALSLLINIGIFCLLYILFFDLNSVISRFSSFSKKELLDRVKAFAVTIMTVFTLTWLIGFSFSGFRNMDPLLLFVFVPFCFFLLRLIIKWLDSFKWGLAIFMLTGFIFRLWLDPDIFLVSGKMVEYISVVLRISIIFSILNMVFSKSSPQDGTVTEIKCGEMAFAPIMFLGVLSLQSPLAPFVISLIRGHGR